MFTKPDGTRVLTHRSSHLNPKIVGGTPAVIGVSSIQIWNLLIKQFISHWLCFLKIYLVCRVFCSAIPVSGAGSGILSDERFHAMRRNAREPQLRSYRSTLRHKRNDERLRRALVRAWPSRVLNGRNHLDQHADAYTSRVYRMQLISLDYST